MTNDIEYSWETFWLGFKDWLFKKSEAKLEEEGVATAEVKTSASLRLGAILVLTFVGLYVVAILLDAGFSNVAPSEASRVIASNMIQMAPLVLLLVIGAMIYTFSARVFRKIKSFISDCCLRGTQIKYGG